MGKINNLKKSSKNELLREVFIFKNLILIYFIIGVIFILIGLNLNHIMVLVSGLFFIISSFIFVIFIDNNKIILEIREKK